MMLASLISTDSYLQISALARASHERSVPRGLFRSRSLRPRSSSKLGAQSFFYTGVYYDLFLQNGPNFHGPVSSADATPGFLVTESGWLADGGSDNYRIMGVIRRPGALKLEAHTPNCCACGAVLGGTRIKLFLALEVCEKRVIEIAIMVRENSFM